MLHTIIVVCVVAVCVGSVLTLAVVIWEWLASTWKRIAARAQRRRTWKAPR